MLRESIAFFRLHQPDFVLAPIVGAEPISRTEITNRVWAYIKANDADWKGIEEAATAAGLLK